MAVIFLSYAHEDEGRIQHVAQELEAQGFSVFWDRRIPTGQIWRSYIGRALSAASCVIVAWSRHSIVSEWVSEEADEGKQRGILVPVLLDSVEPPIGFRSIQASDLTEWKPGYHSPRFDKLIQDITTVLEATPTPGRTERLAEAKRETPPKRPHETRQRKAKVPQSRLTYSVYGLILLLLVGGGYWGYQKWFVEPIPVKRVKKQPMEATQIALERSTFHLPDDGIPMKNARVGPFCCTGMIVIVRSTTGDPIGYIYFFSWEGQAYNSEGGSIVPDLAVLVSGLEDLGDPNSEQVKSRIAFYANRLNPQSDWIQAGSLRYRATVLDFKLEKGTKSRPFFKMGSLKLRIDAQIAEKEKGR